MPAACWPPAYSPSAVRDVERLQRAADTPLGVKQDRLREGCLALEHACVRLQRDPLRTRVALDVDRQVGVDVEPFAPIELVADAVGEVRGDQQPLQRRRLFSGDDGDLQ